MKTTTRVLAWFLPFVGLSFLLAGCASITSNDPDERLRAIRPITDQAFLQQLAMNDPCEAVAIAAVCKLTDQTLLWQLYENQLFDKHPDLSNKNPNRSGVRAAAVQNMTNQEKIAQIALCDKQPNVRLAAVRKLQDQALLTRMATCSMDYVVRFNAILSMTDRDRLASMIETYFDSVNLGAINDIAIIQYYLTNPLVKKYIGDLSLTLDIMPMQRSYSSFRGQGATICGNRINLMIRGGMLKNDLKFAWETTFPTKLVTRNASTYYKYARVDVNKVIDEVYRHIFENIMKQGSDAEKDALSLMQILEKTKEQVQILESKRLDSKQWEE